MYNMWMMVIQMHVEIKFGQIIQSLLLNVHVCERLELRKGSCNLCVQSAELSYLIDSVDPFISLTLTPL